ncbi:Cullin-domain-containing protein [Microthyrium microscopicum]|uniref:Cullin-domain-containing protein n=1 Tax=Microthyrium microscopicum TaxID=703497 RepID=A0A6A6UGS5_9PEZI|nr:Cullin-domain-containing protein [Microthyrium microscopicum]
MDFAKTWSSLESSFRQIHTKETSEISFEELYRGAYRLVLRKKGEELYHRVVKFEEKWLSLDVRAQVVTLVSPELVAASNSTSIVERRFAGERFLKGVKQQWSNHEACMVMLSDVLLYLDRVYCIDKSIPTVYSIGMRLFRDEILKCPVASAAANDGTDQTILTLVIQTMLDHIKMEREGDVIDKTLLKSCTHMLEGMHIDNIETDEYRLYNYRFEPHFLQASRDFYAAESERMLRDSDAGAYCRQAKKRLVEEIDRCKSTLSEATMGRIERVVLGELIEQKLPELILMDTGVVYMIDNDRLEELGLIYELSGKVDDDKKELVKAVQSRIVELGKEINQTAMSPNANTDGNTLVQQTAAAIRWVEDVLSLKDKFDNIWAQAFNKDPRMQTEMTKSFTEFINMINFNRGSEYISLFIDQNMKKDMKDKSDAEVDSVLDKAITLLRFILDKDMFERYYKRHLSKRLLLGRSISLDVEKQMIGKMKIELGNTFTTKIEAMFRDMTTSTELTSSFRHHMSEIRANDPEMSARPIDLTVNILTSQVWPQELANNSNEDYEHRTIIYPYDIRKLTEYFTLFYAGKHNGRKLTWQPAMGTADIKARFPTKDASKDRVHDLNVSTYAMIILYLFNELPAGESLSFEDIQSRTNIPEGDLVRNLQSLACASRTRILLKSPASKDVNPTDKFTFNVGFKSNYTRIKVNVVASGNRVETDRERLKTEQKNDESRSFMCEAAIVRIMKQRKRLSHQQLLSETLAQLTHFKPDVAMIKARIETLIEREYLQRDERDSTMYEYLA